MTGVNNLDEIMNLLIKTNFSLVTSLNWSSAQGASSLSQIAFRLIFFRRQVCSTEQLFTTSAVTSLHAPSFLRPVCSSENKTSYRCLDSFEL